MGIMFLTYSSVGLPVCTYDGRGWGSARAIGAGYYVVLSRILQVNFREDLFHALG